MTHEELRDLCAVHALGALDGAERAEIEAHLETCAACRRLVAEHAEAAAGLSAALRPVSPSAGLRRRIEDAVHAAPGPRLASSRAATPFWAVPAAAAAALIAGVWFGAKWEESRSDAGVPAAQVAKLAEDNRRLRAEQDASRRRIAELELALAADAKFMGEARCAQMKGGVGAEAALAKVFWRGDEVHLMAAGLKTPARGMGYQLWAIADGRKPMKAGQPLNDLRGDSLVGVQKIPGIPQGDVKFAVTLEKIDDVKEPTLPLVLEPAEMK